MNANNKDNHSFLDIPRASDFRSTVMASNEVSGDSCLGCLIGSNDEITNESKRPQFGTRYLTDPQNVFQHNAWDNVEWDETHEEIAKNKVLENSAVIVETRLQESYENEASHFWDAFYGIHNNRFFKDRHWLFTEFPELAPNLKSCPVRICTEARACVYESQPANDDNVIAVSSNTETLEQSNIQPLEKAGCFPGADAACRIWEIGCGVGNTVYPILETNNDNKTFMYCCDFSEVAVHIVKENLLYDINRCYAFICDISQEEWNVPFPEASLDIVILIFVLSAIHPEKMQNVANLISKYLRPGGLLLFRDYGRYDMAQLRFKKGRCLSNNFYVRGDGTRVYFFTQEEIRKLFTKAGLVEEQNLIDRRLQVNRGKLLKMYRVWIQCKFRKPTT